MSAENFEDLHPREAGSGKFEKKNFGEPDVSLSAPAVPAEEAVPAIIAALKSVSMDHNAITRGWSNAMKSGEMSASEVLAEMETINQGGNCSEHPTGYWYGMFSPSTCFQCRIAMATEHTLRSGPEPIPVGRTAKAAKQVQSRQQLSYDHDDDTGITTSTTALTGDEALDAAVRQMLDVPSDTPVAITDTVTESGDYTKEYDHEITVKAGGKTATFDDLGSLIRALDRRDPDGPLEMALRLMRASDARRPLLSGPAAVYPKLSDKPFFAHITQVYPHGGNPTVRVMRLNGLEEYIPLSAISVITETDQTEVYTPQS